MRPAEGRGHGWRVLEKIITLNDSLFGLGPHQSFNTTHLHKLEAPKSSISFLDERCLRMDWGCIIGKHINIPPYNIPPIFSSEVIALLSADLICDADLAARGGK